MVHRTDDFRFSFLKFESWLTREENVCHRTNDGCMHMDHGNEALCFLDCVSFHYIQLSTRCSIIRIESPKSDGVCVRYGSSLRLISVHHSQRCFRRNAGAESIRFGGPRVSGNCGRALANCASTGRGAVPNRGMEWTLGRGATATPLGGWLARSTQCATGTGTCHGRSHAYRRMVSNQKI
jgi:hypothetical protein